MKGKSKCLLGLLFSIAMVLVLAATPVYAEDGDEEQTSYEAKIVNYKGEEIKYSSLSEALAAAGASDTVYLLTDLATSSSISFSHSTTLDLNGYTITYNGSECALKNGLTVTIQNGTVVAISSSEAIRNMNGTLTLKDLTVTGGKYAVQNYASTDTSSDNGYKSATLTIESGTYSVSVSSNSSAVSAVLNAHGTLVIEGGTFTGYTAGVSGYGVATTINGGTFIATKVFDSENKLYSYGLNVSDSSVSISAGTFTGNSMAIYKGTDTVFSSGDYLADGSEVVSGSPFTWGNGTDAMTCVIDQAVSLGVSTSESTTVPGVVVSGKDESTMYVKVYADQIGAYSTSAYPTTTLTFVEDGEEHGYIFAGWYSMEEDGSFTAMTSFPENITAYAKFVDADVLGIQCVFTPSSKTDGAGNVWRFFTSWDAKEYSVFFFVNDGSDNVDSQDVRYYTSYTVTSSNVEIKPSDFSSISTHILTGYYANASASSCTVTACWTTQDGTTVYGSTATYGTSEGGLLVPTATG